MSCATGLQIRDVTCSWNTGADCDPKAKPNSTMPCYAQDCPIITDISDWSGSGASSKEVFNEINVIPHDGLFSSTKNQPRENADLNYIIENDFSHYSRIEKSPENSIVKNLHVDDFYYDYNFIKFHEDLSNDLDEEDTFDISGTKHDLTGTDVPNTTSSLSTTADHHSTTTMYSDTITKGTEGHKPQKEDIVDDNNDVLFAEDYLLPVITTTEPSSSVTRLFNKWKASDTDTEDIGVTRNSLSTADVSLQDKNETVLNIFLTPEPDFISKGNSNTQDDYDGDLKDKTKILVPEDENEGEFGEDVPGGESEWESFQPPHSTQTYDDHIFKFETYENRDVHIPTTLLPWNMASPTVSTTQQSELFSSVPSDDFTKHEPTANPKTSEPWPAVREFTMTSDSLSPESSPTSSFPAKHYSSMTSVAGTTALPPTEMESDFEPPIFTPIEIPDTIIAAETYDWYSTAIALTKNNGHRTEPWGTTVPLPRWTEIDNNEIIIARMLRPSGLNPTLSTPTEQPSQGTSSEHSVHSSSPLMPTGLVMASLYPSASPAHWKKGNWSAVSRYLCIPCIL